MQRALCFCLGLLVAASLVSATSRGIASDERPLASGIDLKNMDTNVRPQDDLFRFVNGKWLATAVIPPDQSRFGAFIALAEQAEKDLRTIVEECAAAKDSLPGSEKQKIGDLYASYMDEARIEQLGIQPIADLLAKIDRIEDKEGLIRTMGELNRAGVPGAVRCHIGSDAKNAGQNILHVGQAGLGLPDRDYYADPKFKKTLAAYAAHVEKVLFLAGVPDAHQAAADVLRLETALADAHWSKLQCRDSDKTYNRRTRDALARLTPGFDWDLFLATLGIPDRGDVIVAQPSFFVALGKLVDSPPLPAWKAWMRWHTVHSYASLLGKSLADADFAFYGTTLHGVPENRPRWKRAVSTVEGVLGEAVGKLYVAKHFPPLAKSRMDRMVAHLIDAYRHAFENNEWMSPETRQKALAKLATFRPKIGYPTKWRDYSKLEIRPDDLVGNFRRAMAFEWNRMLAKLGQPVDRDEWHMTPQTPNAYYNASLNEIVFPAAILQPPFFNFAADDAVNYGGIGAVIGHEIGHGFDDQGSKWDAAGNLANWWTKQDRAEFDRRGAVLAAQYDKFEPFPGFKVNGKFTLGENIGDLSGVTIAYAAYKASLGGKPSPTLDGFTGEQRFFLGFAQVWRCKYRDEELKNRLTTDPHSPAECRANGTPRNVEGFYSAFGLKEGDTMYLPPNQRVKIW
jgi:putative endopeptidase